MDKVQELMMSDVFKEIVQLGIVVPDVEKSKAAMKEVFGLEPDSGGDFMYKKCLYRGEIIDAPVRGIFYDFFNIQIEFLEPLGDQDTVWSDYLKMGKQGLHHVRFDVEDHDRANELMAEKGIGIWMEGSSLVTPGARFTYYDSLEKLGFIVEAVTKVN